MTTRELDKLISKLPPEYEKILWQRLGNVSIQDIKKAMKGSTQNEYILKTAVQLAEEYQAEQMELKEKIKSL